MTGEGLRAEYDDLRRAYTLMVKNHGQMMRERDEALVRLAAAEAEREELRALLHTQEIAFDEDTKAAVARLAAAEADADQLAAVLGWRGARAPRPGEVHTCSLGSCWRCALHSHDQAVALRNPS